MVEKREEFFNRVFKEKLWGGEESFSGLGSTKEATAPLSQELPFVLDFLNIHSILDAPCGDFNWMRNVNLQDVDYIGGDIVSELIERNNALHKSDKRQFIHFDLVKDAIPEVDLVFVRHCFIHFDNSLVLEALRNIVRHSVRYVAISHYNRLAPFRGKNIDLDVKEANVNDLYRPINFLLPPYNFPAPVYIMPGNAHDLFDTMAFWTREQIVASLEKKP